MRRRLPSVLVPLAAVALMVTGCSSPAPLEAKTSNTQNTWTSGGAFCDDEVKDGGGFDIEQVGVSRDGSTIGVWFTMRTMPKVSRTATAVIVYRDKSGHRGGVLTTRWDGSSVPTATVRNNTTGKTTAVTGTSTVNASDQSISTTDHPQGSGFSRRARTISTSYPADLAGTTDATWKWKAYTTLDGKKQDRCTRGGVLRAPSETSGLEAPS